MFERTLKKNLTTKTKYTEIVQKLFSGFTPKNIASTDQKKICSILTAQLLSFLEKKCAPWNKTCPLVIS